ncbi:20977_t:CDS:2 [Cetraspora pellucida]|uniref:20977_t:CDS:1 n=1 Tax=Cetraspora pellucida TaxID=1433469 RepID=A0A9N9P6I8_9GLOM|nr:20977_t:CDS:2 [Cetraspora pellucida]
MVYLRLEDLKISDALISAILHSCSDIRFLILDKSKGFTNIPIIEIARFSPKLQHLSLNSYICLTNQCITEITHSCSNLDILSLVIARLRCRRISNKVLKKLNLKIKIERPDYSDDEFLDSDLPPLIPIFTNETDLISAIVNYLRENPLTKSLFDKLKEDYGIHDPVENLYGDVIDGTEVIDFQIRKNSLFDLVLGQEWLWMHEAKISFGYSPKTCVCHAKIVIDGMSIPLIKEKSNKASSSKNNLFHSETEIDKPDLNLEKFIDIFKKLSIETNLSSSDSESMGSDWYDLDLKKPRKKRIHNTKKKVISPS